MWCTSLALLVLVVVAQAIDEHAALYDDGKYRGEEAPAQPYSFTYAAGRAPGHVDRVHSETRDAGGVVRGEFSYVDPRNNVRTVQYVADEAGFHPVLNSGVAPVTDTPVVARAKLRHLALKERIAAQHAAIGAEHARLNAEQAAHAPEQLLDVHHQY